MSDASMDIIEKAGMVLNYTISSNGINNNSEENNIGNENEIQINIIEDNIIN